MSDPRFPPIAPQIMSFLAYVRWTTAGGDGRALLGALCEASNWASSPSRAMTDREHDACRRLAKYCQSRLARLTGWRESESGRLYV